MFFAKIAGAQAFLNDSLKYSPSFSLPVKLYYESIGENAHLYNGYEYLTPDISIKGSPYFLSDLPLSADLTYEDIFYQHIPVLYDMVKEQIIINRFGQNYRVSLISEKLDSFTIENHDFIRISRDSLNGIELNTGFYDRVYSGKSKVLVNRKKIVQEIVEYSTYSRLYKEEDSYYVYQGGKYDLVTNESSVLKLFKSKKSEIKSYLRKNKLKFRSDFEKTLIATVAYYDQITS